MKGAIRLAALLALAITAGCGVKKETHQKALDEVARLQVSLGTQQAENEDLRKRVKGLESDLDTTRTERDTTSATVKDRDARLGELSKNLQATEAELTELRKQREATEKRLSAFRDLQKKFKQLVDTGKLDVAFRNGQMVLKLPSGVLFDSGKAVLSKQGETALAEILGVLTEFKDRRFLIAGHTDNEPIKTRQFPNNWYLSTARALSVLEFMVEYGFPARNLGAAGYGEQDPVAPNDTSGNKQLNRRIEIILVPDLSELPNLTAEPK